MEFASKENTKIPTKNDVEEKERLLDLIIQNDENAMKEIQIIAFDNENKFSLGLKYYARKCLYILNKKLTPDLISSPSANDNISDENILNKIKENLSSADLQVRQKMVKFIIKNKNVNSLPFLLERLDVEDDALLLPYIITAIGILGDSSHVKHVLKFLYHDNARVRANAIECLTAIGDEKIYPHILPFFNDEDNRVKSSAIIAFKNIGTANCIETLKTMIHSNEIWMQDSAAFALKFFDIRRVFDLVSELLDSPSISVKNKATEILKKAADSGFEQAKILVKKISQQEENIENICDLLKKEINILKKAENEKINEMINSLNKDNIEISQKIDTIMTLFEYESEDIYSRLYSYLIDEYKKLVKTKFAIETQPPASCGKCNTEASFKLLDKEIRIKKWKCSNPKCGFVFESAGPHKIISLIVKQLGAKKSELVINFSTKVLTDNIAEELINNKHFQRIRANAVETLALFDSPKLSTVLLSLINDKNNRVKTNVIIALKNFPGINIMHELKKMIETNDRQAKRSVLFAIIQIATNEVIELLDDLIKDPDEIIKKESIKILQILSQELQVPKAIELQKKQELHTNNTGGKSK
mgnify:CR=1 FL=1